MFPLERTPDEAAFGFYADLLPTGECALVARLPSGLMIVKALVDGCVRYVICDGFTPLYLEACSIEELRMRFGLPQAS